MSSTIQLVFAFMGLRRDGTFQKRPGFTSDRIILREADPNMYDATDAIEERLDRFDRTGYRIPLILLVSSLWEILHWSDLSQILPQEIDEEDIFTLCERLNALGPVDFEGQVWQRWGSSEASSVWPNGLPHISKVALVAVEQEEYVLLSTFSSSAI